MKRLSWSVFLITAALYSSCSDRPQNVPSDSKMVQVMADLEMAEAYIQSKGSRTNVAAREQILKYVLQKNGMTKADFDSTIAWYGRHIDQYDELYKKVDKELARREAKISGNSVEQLSNDLWPYSRNLIISSLASSDNLVFNIPVSEIDKGAQIKWKFKMSIPVSGNAIFGVRYTDGTFSYKNYNVAGDNNEITLQTDTSTLIKEIFGNLRLTENRSFVGLDSIFLTSTPFDSTLYYNINSVRRFRGPLKKLPSSLKTDSIDSKKDSMKNEKENQDVLFNL